MPIEFVFSSRLAEALPTVWQHLEESRLGLDLFAPQVVLVPNQGMRAWLLEEMAGLLGSSDGRRDGIAMNVHVDLMSGLPQLVSPWTRRDDPWRNESVVLHLHEIIGSSPQFGSLIERNGGALAAAMGMSERFSGYSAHRPSMIRAWALGRQVLVSDIPALSTGTRGASRALPLSQRWQFDLWRELRATLGTPSRPEIVSSMESLHPESAVEREKISQVLVFGVQSLTALDLEILEFLSRHKKVEVVVSQPTRGLGQLWASSSKSRVCPELDGDIPFLLRPTEDNPPVGVDRLIHTWTRSSMELQNILTWRGHEWRWLNTERNLGFNSLLSLAKQAVTEGRAPSNPSQTHPVQEFASVQLHQCHSLGRQIEVVHDELMTLFKSRSGLRPDEVAVVCANLENAAPLLEATFNRGFLDSTGRKVRIPLAVAGASNPQEDPGTALISTLVREELRRFSIDDVLEIGSNGLVAKSLNISAEDIEIWASALNRARVQWGVDPADRRSEGVDVDSDDSKTWLNGLERSLLGALLPRSAAGGHTFAGRAPLGEMDLDDVGAISKLIVTVRSIARFVKETHVTKSLTQWCATTSTVVSELAGRSAGTDGLLGLLDRMSSGSPGTENTATVQITFDEFCSYMRSCLPGLMRQTHIRSGKVVASSIQQLRGVPYKVICFVGFDREVLASPDLDASNLLSLQNIEGDPDPRLDQRRALLDLMCAANDCFIVTCTGRDLRRNTPVPLVTPLQEWLEFLQRCATTGVQVVRTHPRHPFSEENFEPSGIEADTVWTIDHRWMKVASEIRRGRTSRLNPRVPPYDDNSRALSQ